jgi:hypothetical protein
MKVRGVVLAAVAAAASIGVGADIAAACSCAPQNTQARLDGGDWAVVGKVVGGERPSESHGVGQRIEYTVRVERALNVDLASEIVVTAPANQATCGFEWSPGERVGAFIHPGPGSYQTTACELIDPERLLRTAGPRGRPPGRGRPAFIATGDVGSARTMALGPRGRVLAYGFGLGTVYDISVCPGSRLAVELVMRDFGRMFVGVRDLRSFKIVRSDWFHGLAERVHCLDRRAQRIHAGFVNSVMCIQAPCKGEPRVNLYELYRDGSVRSSTLTGGSVAFSGDTAFVGGARRVIAKRFGEPRARTVARVRNARQITASPDGRRLVFDTAGGTHLLDLHSDRLHRLSPSHGEPFTWLGRDRLLVSGDSSTGQQAGIFDNRLRLVRGLPYVSAKGVLRGERLFESVDGDLVSTQIGNGERRRVAQLADLRTEKIVAVPDALPLRASRRVPAVAGPSSAERCRKQRRD